MSGIVVKPLRAVVRLHCDKCGAMWESEDYYPERFGDEVIAAQPAFDFGWTLYNAGNGRRVYCPRHEPTAPMRLMYGRVL